MTARAQPSLAARTLADAALTTFAGPYYVAANDTQRNRAKAECAAHLEPLLAEILTQHARQVACLNPS